MRAFPPRPAFEAFRDCLEGCLLVLVDGIFERASGRAIALGHELKHGDGGNEAGRDKLLEWTFGKPRSLDVEALCLERAE
jgi:hypothetical protein